MKYIEDRAKDWAGECADHYEIPSTENDDIPF